MLRKVLLGALMVVALFAAPASAQYGDFVVNPGTVSVGGNAAFQGRGCAPGSSVVLTINGATVATVTADASGDFSGSFSANLPAGSYSVVATCGDLVRTSPLAVRSTSAGSPGTGGTSLPRTGSNSDTLALVGAGLLLAGGAAVLATRKHSAA